MLYFSVDWRNSIRIGSIIILNGIFSSSMINLCSILPVLNPPFSSSVTIDEIEGNDKLQISSSLSTPIRDNSLGISILLTLHISETCEAKLSSQANKATGFGKDISHSSNLI